MIFMDEGEIVERRAETSSSAIRKHERTRNFLGQIAGLN